MKIFISGATGFIGGHLALRLVEEGHVVRTLARPTSDVSLLESLGTEVVVGDIVDYAAVREAVEGCELVYHTARAKLKERHSLSMFQRINVGGTENLMRASVETGIRRVVHCSSISVYGRPRRLPTNEQTPCRPTSVHGRTKLEAENVVRRHGRDGRPPAVIARLTAVMGPRAVTWRRLFASLLEGRWIVLGSGSVRFQVTDVDDVVRGLRLCAERDNAAGKTYILGSEDIHRLSDFAWMVAEEAGVEIRCRRLPLTPFVWLAGLSRYALHPMGVEPDLVQKVDFFARERWSDVTKAKSELGFLPRHSLRETVRRTLSWYRENGRV